MSCTQVASVHLPTGGLHGCYLIASLLLVLHFSSLLRYFVTVTAGGGEHGGHRDQRERKNQRANLHIQVLSLLRLDTVLRRSGC